ncbi:MAG: hypothetical protein CM1200mP28_00750 [Deltaproteobacteria bacterium]|nr:MAG: hypothetical protein CM1200mP28_00750 [Deltaproteobacteria bacterium]
MKLVLIFREVRNNGKYREQSISMLLESHKQLEDWKSITWELQDVFLKKKTQNLQSIIIGFGFFLHRGAMILKDLNE